MKIVTELTLPNGINPVAVKAKTARQLDELATSLAANNRAIDRVAAKITKLEAQQVTDLRELGLRFELASNLPVLQSGGVLKMLPGEQRLLPVTDRVCGTAVKMPNRYLTDARTYAFGALEGDVRNTSLSNQFLVSVRLLHWNRHVVPSALHNALAFPDCYEADCKEGLIVVGKETVTLRLNHLYLQGRREDERCFLAPTLPHSHPMSRLGEFVIARDTETVALIKRMNRRYSQRVGLQDELEWLHDERQSGEDKYKRLVGLWVRSTVETQVDGVVVRNELKWDIKQPSRIALHCVVMIAYEGKHGDNLTASVMLVHRAADESQTKANNFGSTVPLRATETTKICTITHKETK